MHEAESLHFPLQNRNELDYFLRTLSEGIHRNAIRNSIDFVVWATAIRLDNNTKESFKFVSTLRTRKMMLQAAKITHEKRKIAQVTQSLLDSHERRSRKHKFQVNHVVIFNWKEAKVCFKHSKFFGFLTFHDFNALAWDDRLEFFFAFDQFDWV